jgi:rubrerythrin
MAELGYTGSMQDEFMRLLTVKSPTLSDLKVLALMESAGKSAYEAQVRGVSDEGVKTLLMQNAREEYAHAVRLRQAIKLLYGEDFVIPADSENSFATPETEITPVRRESLEALAQGEIMGGDFYDGWADALENQEAAALLRQNAQEERRHADRLREAAALL